MVTGFSVPRRGFCAARTELPVTVFCETQLGDYPPLRIHVDLPAGEGGLRKPSRIKCDQVGKVDIRRFRAKGKLGEIRPETLRRVELAARRLLEL